MAVLALAAAATLIAVSVVAPPWTDADAYGPSYAVVAIAIIICELRPILVFRGDKGPDAITVTTPLSVTLLVVAPLSVAIVVHIIALLLEDLRSRRPFLKVCFNAAQYVVSLFVARLALDIAGGPDLLAGHSSFGLGDVVPTLVAAVVLVVVNYLLVAVVVALDAQEPFRRVVSLDLQFSLATSAVLVSLAPVTAFVVAASPWMVLLLLAPLFALHRNTALIMQREAAALRDSLTGLGNRKFFELRGGRRLTERMERGEQSVVLLIGLDHFDEINDTLGHSVGDAILLETASRIQRTVPDGTVGARLGDQYVLMVPTDVDTAKQLAFTLLNRLDAPAELGDVRLVVQTSIGMAVAPEHGTGAEELLRNAGVAMHDSAHHGGRISVYTPEADNETRERLQLLSELRTAIDEDQFFLAFQPQISVATGEVVGVEALIRWEHPTRGTVYPDSFIGLAENSGLISQVTDVVLDRALATVARLRAEGHALRVAVNMSARQMSDITLPGTVAEALARHALPPTALTLEVTETGILTEPARVDAVVRALRETGVSIAVDDYGTGQASLTYLKRLHVDELKIDKSFVIDMRTDSGDAIIVRSTIELGHDLGLRIVAEGVEDAVTLQLLQRLGSDLAQGWHIGRPMPEAELRQVLRARVSPQPLLTRIGKD